MADNANPDQNVAVLNHQIGVLENEKASLSAEITALKTSLEEFKTTSATRTAELENELTALKEEKLAALKQAQEAKFSAFLETVPAGEKATEDAVTALKTAYFEDPHSLITKSAEWAAKQAALPGKTGTRQVAMKTAAGEEAPARKYGNLFKRS